MHDYSDRRARLPKQIPNVFGSPGYHTYHTVQLHIRDGTPQDTIRQHDLGSIPRLECSLWLDVRSDLRLEVGSEVGSAPLSA